MVDTGRYITELIAVGAGTVAIDPEEEALAIDPEEGLKFSRPKNTGSPRATLLLGRSTIPGEKMVALTVLRAT